MSNSRQVVFGILAALLSVTILLGSLSLALAEGKIPALFAPTKTQPIPSSVTPVVANTQIPAFETQVVNVPTTATPSATLLSTGTPVPTTMASPTPTATAYCTPMAGWTSVTVQPGDTLDSLAQTYHTSVTALKAANCLMTDDLIPGTILYVPGAEPTATEYRCGPPAGWVFYTIQSGDTLYSIATAFGTTVAALQQANCMGSSTDIRAGQQLYVPNIPTVTPKISPTPWIPPTLLPTPPGMGTITPEPPIEPTAVPTPTYAPPPKPTYWPATPTDIPGPAAVPAPDNPAPVSVETVLATPAAIRVLWSY